MEWNLRLLGVSQGVRVFGNALYNPFLALFVHAVLGVGYLEIGVLFFVVGVTQLPFGVLGGLLTDRFGRRRIILIGLTAEAAITFALAYAFDLKSLAGAILAGTVGGMIVTAAGPAMSAYVADFATGSERTKGFTFIRIGFNAGFSAGVTVGGVLISAFGYVLAVAAAGSIILAGAALVAFALSPSPFDRELAARPDRRRGPESAPGGAPGAQGPSIRESLRALRHDRIALEVSLAFALAALFLGQWAVTFPLFVHDVLGIPYSLLGVGLALNGLVVVFGQTLTTRSVLGRPLTTVGIAGVALYLVAFLGLGAAGYWAFFPVPVFFLAVVVLTVGENLAVIPQTTLPSNMAPPDSVGLYNGAFNAIGGAGFLGSVLLGGWVLSVSANPLLIWLVLGTPAVPAILLLNHAGRGIPTSQNRA